MSDFLTHLAALSLGGALAGLALMAVARFTRTRYAARWRCLAWLLLCLRLIIPIQLLPQQSMEQAPIQLTAPAMERPILPQTSPQPSQSQGQSGQGNTPSSSQPFQPPATFEEPTPSPDSDSPLAAVSFSHVLLLVWLLGLIAVLGWSILSHLRFLRYLRRWAAPVQQADILRIYNSLGDKLALHRRPGLLLCPGLPVPMLAGVVRPVLLLPQDATAGKDLEYALLHELIHYRRRDIWLKALALAASAVHWFNPLLWLMRRAVEQDTELACDEAALLHLPPEEHTAYGQTILHAVSRLKTVQTF